MIVIIIISVITLLLIVLLSIILFTKIPNRLKRKNRPSIFVIPLQIDGY
jgi:hypothetical protein